MESRDFVLMSRLERIYGTVVGAIGYILSPLSWWNDLYVNLPIAYILAWPVALSNEKLFPAALVFFYWVTNIVGLLLLHKGAVSAIKGKRIPYWTKRQLLLDFSISILYTMVIIVLIYLDVLRTPHEYLDYLK